MIPFTFHGVLLHGGLIQVRKLHLQTLLRLIQLALGLGGEGKTWAVGNMVCWFTTWHITNPKKLITYYIIK